MIIKFSFLKDVGLFFSEQLYLLERLINHIFKKISKKVIGWGFLFLLFILTFLIMIKYPIFILLAVALLSFVLILNLRRFKDYSYLVPALILLILFYFFVDEMSTSNVMIEKIDVPEEFTKEHPGLTGEVLARQLSDEIAKWQEKGGDLKLSDIEPIFNFDMNLGNLTVLDNLPPQGFSEKIELPPSVIEMIKESNSFPSRFERYRFTNEIGIGNIVSMDDKIQNKSDKQLLFFDPKELHDSERFKIADRGQVDDIFKTKIVGLNYSPFQIINFLKSKGYLRGQFGYHYYLISGEVVKGFDKRGWSLTLRIKDFNNTFVNKNLLTNKVSFELVAKQIIIYLEPTLRLNVYLKQRKDYNSALSYIEKIIPVIKPTDDDNRHKSEPVSNALYYNIRGAIYTEQGDYEKAEANYKAAIYLDKELCSAYYNLAVNNYKFKGASQALTTLNRMIEENGSKNNCILMQAYFFKGKLHEELDQTEDTIRSYKKALSLSSDYLAAHNNLGVLYMKEKKYDEAEIEFNQAITKDYFYVPPHNNLGTLYMERGNLIKAEIEINKAISIDYYYSPAYESLGVLYMKKGKYKEAEEKLKKAIDFDFDYIPAYESLGELYINTGKYEDAEIKFKEAIEILTYKSSSLDSIHKKMVLLYEKQGLKSKAQYYRDKLN